jgi:hypothetical protein
MSIITAVPLLSIETNNTELVSESKEHQDQINHHEEDSERLSLRAAVFGIGFTFGFSVASVAFFAAEALFFRFNNGSSPTSQDILEQASYAFLFLIIKLAYAAHFTASLSAVIVALLTHAFGPQKLRSWMGRANGGITIVRTILFQGGFFASITLLFLVIQVYLPTEYIELHDFVAAFIDRFAMVAIVNSLLVLVFGCGGSSSSSSSRTSTSEEEERRMESTGSEEETHYVRIV